MYQVRRLLTQVVQRGQQVVTNQIVAHAVQGLTCGYTYDAILILVRLISTLAVPV